MLVAKNSRNVTGACPISRWSLPASALIAGPPPRAIWFATDEICCAIAVFSALEAPDSDKAIRSSRHCASLMASNLTGARSNSVSRSAMWGVAEVF